MAKILHVQGDDGETTDEVVGPVNPLTPPTSAAITTGDAPTAAPAGLPAPSFDFDPKTKKPNLMPGETVIAESSKYGFPVFVTSNARKIFCCTFAEYAAAGFTLPRSPEEYAAAFPQALS